MHANKKIKGGLFIVFEGIDGTGKSSQCKLLNQTLSELGYDVHLDKEPSDHKYGAILRQSATTGRLSPEQELEYFHLDRKMHVEELIQPAKESGEVVILDRYYFSTMAYQGQRGFNPEQLRAQNEAFAPKPDLLFILDLPAEISLERIGGRGDEANAFEGKESLQYCREIFLGVSEEPFAHVIDSRQTIEEVHQEILTIVNATLNDLGSA